MRGLKQADEQMHTHKNIRKRLLILCILIVVLLLASIYAIYYINSTKPGGSVMAYIYRNNEIIDTINLSEVTDSYRITYDYGDDYNVVEVRQGSIGIVEATCPDHLCMNMGFISNELMPVTCLPNHLVISVVQEGNIDNRDLGDGVDAIVY